MPLELDYQRAAEAALAADKAAVVAHSALFDFARELGEAIAPFHKPDATLPVHVRFVRQAPPKLDAPSGVHVQDAPKERPAGFASVMIEARDLYFAIESIPGVAIAAQTNVPALESYASAICGVHTASDARPHLLATTEDGSVAVPAVHSATALLEVFLVLAGDVFATRAQFNPLPS